MVKKSKCKEECYACRHLYGFVLSPKCKVKGNPQEKEIKCKKYAPVVGMTMYFLQKEVEG